MFLYLFSLWFLSIFSSSATTVVSTTVAPKLCIQGDFTRSLPLTPYPLTQKNVLLVTDDGGTTWKDFTGDLPSEVLPSCLWVDQKEWLIGAAQGLYIGNPGLTSAKWKQDPLVPKDVTYFISGKTGLYAISYSNGIYRRQTSSDLWSKVSGLLMNSKPYFTFTETSEGNLVAGGENGIYFSDHDAHCWKQVYENVGVNDIKDFDGVLLACSWRGLLRSTDGGNHWDVTLPGNTTVFRTREVDGGIIAFVEGQEFAGVRAPNEVMISKDKGQTWKPMFTSLPNPLKSIYDLVQVGNVYFAVSNFGVYRSADHGATWDLTVSPNRDQAGFFRLVVEGNTLYALQVPGC